MRVINDPLGQTHSPASSDPYFRLNFVLFFRDFEKWARTYGRTTRAKIVTTAGRDCGSILPFHKNFALKKQWFLRAQYNVLLSYPL